MTWRRNSETLTLQQFEDWGCGGLQLNTSFPIEKGQLQFSKSMFLTATCRNPEDLRRGKKNLFAIRITLQLAVNGSIRAFLTRNFLNGIL